MNNSPLFLSLSVYISLCLYAYIEIDKYFTHTQVIGIVNIRIDNSKFVLSSMVATVIHGNLNIHLN